MRLVSSFLFLFVYLIRMVSSFLVATWERSPPLCFVTCSITNEVSSFSLITSWHRSTLAYNVTSWAWSPSSLLFRYWCPQFCSATSVWTLLYYFTTSWDLSSSFRYFKWLEFSFLFYKGTSLIFNIAFEPRIGCPPHGHPSLYGHCKGFSSFRHLKVLSSAPPPTCKLYCWPWV